MNFDPRQSMQNSPQKLRKIFGVCLGILMLSAVLIIGGGWLVLSPASPINRASAIDATQKWARVADFPPTITDLHIKTAGSMFTREFSISFRDTPTNIRAWLAASPGPASVSPAIDSSGWKIYQYTAGEGAAFAEVRVSPAENEVRIIAYWS